MLNIIKYGQRFTVQCRKIFQVNNCVELQTRFNQIVTNFHSNACYRAKDDDSNKKDSNVSPTIGTKYEVFRDDNATIILDIEEERDKLLSNEMEEIEDATPSIFDGLNTEHGKTGVFDIEDLITVLKRDNAQDIFVCTVPKELKYVDYLVVITARSQRHMKALAEFVRKMYKMKSKKKTQMPRIEGEHSEDWMAIDLGNIALHIFSKKARQQYDIEMLWSVGAEFDTETNKPEDPILEFFDQHSILMGQSKNVNCNEENSIDLDHDKKPSNIAEK